MKKKIFILFAISILTGQSFSQTFVSGGIFSNTTWTVAASPYIVTDTVVVLTGVTLTISPGVIVKFNNGKGMEIRGYLDAIGTPTDSITFTSSSPTPTMGIWYGINLTNRAKFKYINLLYSNTGFHFIVSFTAGAFSNSRFYKNNNGIFNLTQGTPTSDSCYLKNSIFDSNNNAVTGVYRAMFIENCTFTNNVKGIGYVYMTPTSNCLFTGNSDKAITCDGASFYNNIIQNNNIGFKMHSFSSTIVQNNIITDNNYGFQVIGDPTDLTHSIKHNTICNNTIYNVENQSNVSIDFEDNCWCTTDSATIANSIRDAYDLLSLGVIDYSPLQFCTTNIEAHTKTENSIVFPNPFMFSTTLVLSTIIHNGQVKIYDALGNLIRTLNIQNEKEILVERENLPNGIYIYEVSDHNELITRGKLVAE